MSPQRRSNLFERKKTTGEIIKFMMVEFRIATSVSGPCKMCVPAYCHIKEGHHSCYYKESKS